jgi:hypothetical protein
MGSRRIGYALMAVGAVAAGTMVVAPSASAAVTYSAYLFADRDYMGRQTALSNNDIAQLDWNDTISSLMVPRGNTWCFYVDANFQGAYIRAVGPYNVYYVGDNFNDKISSAKRC